MIETFLTAGIQEQDSEVVLHRGAGERTSRPYITNPAELKGNTRGQAIGNLRYAAIRGAASI
jgi:hypothetical protein